MRSSRLPLVGLAAAVLVAVSGCAADEPDVPDATPTAGTTSAPSGGATGAPGPSGSATPGPAGGRVSVSPPSIGSGYKVTYNWNVPSQQAVVRHDVKLPVAPPPAPPLPVLTRITVGDHPGERPPFSRISFAFTGAVPEYNIQYVREVLSEGSGSRVSLAGNSFLRIQFVHAQAHDGSYRSSIVAAPPPQLGFRNLISYGFGGDFEGYVTYGLGIQVVPGGDQALPIRVGESRRPDGTYVVSFDVQLG